MADFIIKPASGDTLKLQDEGGDDAISISTTGVSTIANATITSGTFANATITAGTFPTGMVLQVQSHHLLTDTSVVNDNTNILTKTFNRIKGNSHFLVWYVLSLAPYANQDNQDLVDPKIKLVVNGSNVTQRDANTGDGFYNSAVPNWRNNVDHNGRYDIYQITNSADVTNISSGSDNDSVTIAINLTAASLGLNVNTSQADVPSGGVSSLVIWEVQ